MKKRLGICLSWHQHPTVCCSLVALAFVLQAEPCFPAQSTQPKAAISQATVLVSVDALQSHVEADVRSALDQIPGVTGGDRSLDPVVHLQAARLAQAVHSLPVHSVDNWVASEIDGGIVKLAKTNQHTLLHGAASEREHIAKQLASQIEKRLSFLNSNQIRLDLILRKTVLAQTLAWQKTARKKVYDALASHPEFIVHATRGDLVFTRMVTNLKISADGALPQRPGTAEDEQDLAPIAHGLLTLALMRDLSDAIDNASRPQEQLSDDLFSSLYDDPVKSLDTARRMPQPGHSLDQVLTTSVVTVGGVTRLDLAALCNGIQASYPFVEEHAPFAVPKGSAVSQSVRFPNQASLWPLILKVPSASPSADTLTGPVKIGLTSDLPDAGPSTAWRRGSRLACNGNVTEPYSFTNISTSEAHGHIRNGIHRA